MHGIKHQGGESEENRAVLRDIQHRILPQGKSKQPLPDTDDYRTQGGLAEHIKKKRMERHGNLLSLHHLFLAKTGG